MPYACRIEEGKSGFFTIGYEIRYDVFVYFVVFMNYLDKIGILGGGVEGIALAEYLIKHGYRDITIFDENPEFGKNSWDRNALADHSGGSKSSTGKWLLGTSAGVKVVSGADAFEKIHGCKVIFRSPGIHPKKVKRAPKNLGEDGALTEKPVKQDLLVTSTTQFFLENCPCRVIGVTGTKGKGTTATLIHKMLKEAGFDAYLGGNIGESPLTFLEKLKVNSVVVLELSSFQLQDLTISPHAAVVLRTTSEHLDYHKDTTEYREAKAPIVRFQKSDDIAVFNKDYDYWKQYADMTPAKKFFVSMKDEIDSDGAYISGTAILNRAGGKCELIGDSEKVALPGRFNLENVLPAVVVARYFGVPIAAIQKVIYSFAGLPHRLEFVKKVNGVKYYNDSFSTTPETSIAAVYAFNAPVLLIAGGSEKNSDYSEWALQLQKNHNLKMVFLMGHTADRMERALKAAAEKLKGFDIMGEFPVKIWRCATLEDAVLLAAKLALPGENIIMSPAAASFDQFKNYKYRGEAFKKIVGEL
jgi:UDP-N-acetylmuramoylalanine--D-glutamate ligase